MGKQIEVLLPNGKRTSIAAEKFAEADAFFTEKYGKGIQKAAAVKAAAKFDAKNPEATDEIERDSMSDDERRRRDTASENARRDIVGMAEGVADAAAAYGQWAKKDVAEANEAFQKDGLVGVVKRNVREMPKVAGAAANIGKEAIKGTVDSYVRLAKDPIGTLHDRPVETVLNALGLGAAAKAAKTGKLAVQAHRTGTTIDALEKAAAAAPKSPLRAALDTTVTAENTKRAAKAAAGAAKAKAQGLANDALNAVASQQVAAAARRAEKAARKAEGPPSVLERTKAAAGAAFPRGKRTLEAFVDPRGEKRRAAQSARSSAVAPPEAPEARAAPVAEVADQAPQRRRADMLRFLDAVEDAEPTDARRAKPASKVAEDAAPDFERQASQDAFQAELDAGALPKPTPRAGAPAPGLKKPAPKPRRARKTAAKERPPHETETAAVQAVEAPPAPATRAELLAALDESPPAAPERPLPRKAPEEDSDPGIERAIHAWREEANREPTTYGKHRAAKKETLANPDERLDALDVEEKDPTKKANVALMLALSRPERRARALEHASPELRAQVEALLKADAARQAEVVAAVAEAPKATPPAPAADPLAKLAKRPKRKAPKAAAPDAEPPRGDGDRMLEAMNRMAEAKAAELAPAATGLPPELVQALGRLPGITPERLAQALEQLEEAVAPLRSGERSFRLGTSKGEVKRVVSQILEPRRRGGGGAGFIPNPAADGVADALIAWKRAEVQPLVDEVFSRPEQPKRTPAGTPEKQSSPAAPERIASTDVSPEDAAEAAAYQAQRFAAARPHAEKLLAHHGSLRLPGEEGEEIVDAIASRIRSIPGWADDFDRQLARRLIDELEAAKPAAAPAAAPKRSAREAISTLIDDAPEGEPVDTLTGDLFAPRASAPSPLAPLLGDAALKDEVIAKLTSGKPLATGDGVPSANVLRALPADQLGKALRALMNSRRNFKGEARAALDALIAGLR